MSESTYRGRALSEHSKSELIAIIEEMGRAQQRATDEHLRQLDILTACRHR